MEDPELTPSPIRNHFRDHKDCNWTCQGGSKQRKYGGDIYPVLSFYDETCSMVETIPIERAGSDNVAISDSLRNAMGWNKFKFLFGKAWFFRAATDENCPEVGHYLVTFFHLTDQGAVCYFGNEAG